MSEASDALQQIATAITDAENILGALRTDRAVWVVRMHNDDKPQPTLRTIAKVAGISSTAVADILAKHWAN